jgi:hypothetical protein
LGSVVQCSAARSRSYTSGRITPCWWARLVRTRSMVVCSNGDNAAIPRSWVTMVLRVARRNCSTSSAHSASVNVLSRVPGSSGLIRAPRPLPMATVLPPTNVATVQTWRKTVQADPSPVDSAGDGDGLPAVIAGERRCAVWTAAPADAVAVWGGCCELLHPQALGALAIRAALGASEAFALTVLVADLDDLPDVACWAKRQPDARCAVTGEARQQHLHLSQRLGVQLTGIELLAGQQS